MTTIFDILRLTPKNNCGKCGFPTCMAFSASVVCGKTSSSKCPFLPNEEERGRGKKEDEESRESSTPETMLLKELQKRIRHLDLATRANGLGARVVSSEDERKLLELFFLGQKVSLSADVIKAAQGEELDPRDQILLYNYIFFGGSGPLSGEWVGLESFPNSISKVVTLKRYTEDRLSEFFAGRPALLVERAEKIGGKKIEPCYADVCVEIPVLPKVIIRIHFWDQDEEDGFAAQVKVLFDKRAMDFLDLESLVFTAERMAEKMTDEG